MIIIKDYFVSVYQVLKAIELSSYNNSFSYFEILNLEQLNLNENELEVILKNLTNDGYIKGFAITSLGTKNIEHPYLTTKGYEYLTENTMMKKAYKFLKEIKGWIPTMN
ncbi:YjcQ family protein [Fusobacterium nucleatum]|uniref:YjcQ family protein n=1 Tax=Fusobacterium nucleatum TaxID=851 RepID=UPI0030D2DA89